MNKDDFSGIYLITCNRAGQLPAYYIGQSIRVRRRIGQHRTALKYGRHVNPRMQRLWDKAGAEEFEFKALCASPVGQLDELELWFIQEMLGSRACLNIGTDPCAPMRGRKFSAVHRDRIAAGHSGENHYSFGKPLGAEHKASISIGGKGLKRGADTRSKISAANLGANNSMHGVVGAKHPRSKAVEGTNISTGIVIRFESANLARRAGFDQGRISHCCAGNAKTHMGYVWRFICPTESV